MLKTLTKNTWSNLGQNLFTFLLRIFMDLCHGISQILVRSQPHWQTFDQPLTSMLVNLSWSHVLRMCQLVSQRVIYYLSLWLLYMSRQSALQLWIKSVISQLWQKRLILPRTSLSESKFLQFWFLCTHRPLGDLDFNIWAKPLVGHFSGHLLHANGILFIIPQFQLYYMSCQIFCQMFWYLTTELLIPLLWLWYLWHLLLHGVIIINHSQTGFKLPLYKSR